MMYKRAIWRRFLTLVLSNWLCGCALRIFQNVYKRMWSLQILTTDCNLHLTENTVVLFEQMATHKPYCSFVTASVLAFSLQFPDSLPTQPSHDLIRRWQVTGLTPPVTLSIVILLLSLWSCVDFKIRSDILVTWETWLFREEVQFNLYPKLSSSALFLQSGPLFYPSQQWL